MRMMIAPLLWGYQGWESWINSTCDKKTLSVYRHLTTGQDLSFWDKGWGVDGVLAMLSSKYIDCSGNMDQMTVETAKSMW